MTNRTKYAEGYQQALADINGKLTEGGAEAAFQWIHDNTHPVLTAVQEWQASRKDLYTDIVKAVRDHALAHYNDGGWDVIVEAWDDNQILDTIGYATTAKGAIKKVASIVDIYADRQADAINSAF